MVDFAAWYRREDYDRIRAIMQDGEQFPETFEDWEANARHAVAEAEARGAPLRLVELDPDEFVAFCRDKALPTGPKGRMHYTIAKGAARHRH